MTVNVTYDAALCSSPMAVNCRLLENQLRPVVGGKLDGGAPANVGVSEDMDPLHRTAGEEIHVTYSESLTAQETADALAIVAAHDNSVEAPNQTLMTSTELTGEIPPGGRCLIDTGAGQAERTLPKVVDAHDVAIMRCTGANDMIIKPHASEQGSVTIDGAATLTMGDGETAVFGVDGGGNWVNIGPKGLA